MFSTNADDAANGAESLSLDDLDMDYEQIMQYFDNLKVRGSLFINIFIIRYNVWNCGIDSDNT